MPAEQGGYLHHVLLHAARELYGVEVENIEMVTRRGEDFKDTEIKANGETKMKLATVCAI